MRHLARLGTVALACALALSACQGETPRDPSPAATSVATGAVAAIPDDFPLSAGMGGPRDTVPTSRTGTGLRDLELCGTSPLRGLVTRDRMVADNSGGESADTRDLVVLPAPGDASRLAEEIAELATGCARRDGSGDMQTRTEVLASPFAPRPAATLLQTYSVDGRAGDGATVVHVVPAGAALLVTSTYGQWTGDDVDGAVARTVGPLRETVAALTTFGERAAGRG